MISPRFSWIAAFLFVLSVNAVSLPHASATESCALRAISELLHRIGVGNEWEIYQCGFCYQNSGELARKISHELGHTVKIEDLKILFIKHVNYDPLREQDELGMQIKINAEASRGGPKIWSYHFVLRYEDQIIDLDFQEGKQLVNVSDYFQTMFPKEHQWLTVTEFPATEYLNRFSHRRSAEEDELIMQFPTKSVHYYLEQLKKPPNP